MESTSRFACWTLRGRSLLPIVQGGMGVGVSAHRLAGSVARLGALGTISSVELRQHHPDLLEAGRGKRDKALLDRHNLEALDREIRERCGDFIDGHRLSPYRCDSHCLVAGVGIYKVRQEVVELRRAQNRVRDCRKADEIFLCEFGAEVTARQQAVGADDRQRQVMADARSGFRGQEVATHGLEKRQDCLVLPRGRIGDIDDHLSAGQRRQ